MVIVNDKKFACESCIKGHRSSGCQHSDRPLFEVKKKGRPVSQCEKCRELRKTKKMHGKCTCASSSGVSVSGENAETGPSHIPGPKPKARRFKPIAPALPNGLKDLDTDREDRADKTLNLCRCGGTDASICTCGHERGASSLANTLSGLAVLAQAAMYCCHDNPPATSAETPAPQVTDAAAADAVSRKHTRPCCGGGPSSRPPSPKPKRSKRSPVTPPAPIDLTQSAEPSSSYTPFTIPPPVFPPVTSLHAVTSTEGACCCGTQCSCPGCLVHRGTTHVSNEHKDCTEGECSTCVNNEDGAALPTRTLAYSQGGSAASSTLSFAPFASPPLASSSASTAPSRSRRPSVSYIDAFFATAAALPLPPPGRSRTLDPMDTRILPRGALTLTDLDARSRFGLVEVPKLQCSCPGGCGCPEGRCECGDGCTGCAPAHEDEGESEDMVVDGKGLQSARAPSAEEERRDAEGAAVQECAVPVRSCCCG